jgi:hypothetical protein
MSRPFEWTPVLFVNRFHVRVNCVVRHVTKLRGLGIGESLRQDDCDEGLHSRQSEPATQGPFQNGATLSLRGLVRGVREELGAKKSVS